MARSYHNRSRKGCSRDIRRGNRAERTAERAVLRTTTDWDNAVVPVARHTRDYDRGGANVV